MIGANEKRDMIPRWRQTATVAAAAEGTPIPSSPRGVWLDDLSEVEVKRAEWEREKVPFRAVELVTAALLYQQPEWGEDAARSLLDSESEARRGLAEKFFGLVEPESVHDDHAIRIRQLRDGLRREPRNPFGWADLALAHASAGNREGAHRAMRTALTLSPNHRIVLRSASRFFIHHDRSSYAHRILQRAEDIRTDPWLLAAELGTASSLNRTSRFTRAAKGLINDGSITPAHKTELAGALGTLHFWDGNTRHARKLFELSLAKPTDNSVAQAQWATNHGLGTLHGLPEHVTIQRGFEARARLARMLGEWSVMLHECQRWLSDEPFAVEPAINGSFGASIGAMDFDAGIRFARAGLVANPSSQLLRNNLVFALVHRDQNGDLAEAVREFRRVGKPKGDMAITLGATEGLLRYRRGSPREGRRLYLKAIKEARSKGMSARWQQAHPHELTLASLFFVYEEQRAGTRLQESQPMQDAWEQVKKSRLPELALWQDRLESRITIPRPS